MVRRAEGVIPENLVLRVGTLKEDGGTTRFAFSLVNWSLVNATTLLQGTFTWIRVKNHLMETPYLSTASFFYCDCNSRGHGNAATCITAFLHQLLLKELRNMFSIISIRPKQDEQVTEDNYAVIPKELTALIPGGASLRSHIVTAESGR